jgi:hypothetical protein
MVMGVMNKDRSKAVAVEERPGQIVTQRPPHGCSFDKLADHLFLAGTYRDVPGAGKEGKIATFPCQESCA